MRRSKPRLTPDQKAGKEARLAAAVVKWLEEQGWDVYQEVQYLGPGGQVADIIAVKDGIPWIIECKTGINLTVLMQVSRHEAPRRSIAIPASRGHFICTGPRHEGREFLPSGDERRFAYQVAFDFCRAGILEVNSHGHVTETRAAPERAGAADLIIAALRPEHKTFAKAGAAGGGYWTPYKDTIGKVRAFIESRPGGVSMKEIIAALGKMHYANEKSARQQLRAALEGWESDWCRAEPPSEGRSLVMLYYIRAGSLLA